MRRLPVVFVPLAVACFASRDKQSPSPVSEAPDLGSLSLSASTPYSVDGVPFAGGGNPIALLARLQRGSFSGTFNPEVSVAVTPSGRQALPALRMAPAPGLGPDIFQGVVPTTGLPDGPCRLVATADGGGGVSWTSAAVLVTIDNTPPNVELLLPSLAPAPLPRDFSLEASMRADDGTGSGVVAIGLHGTGVPSGTAHWPMIAQANAPGPGVLGKGHVSGLDLPLLPGAIGSLQGTFELTATAVDGLGNLGSASLSLAVTRVRWTVPGPSFTTSPVLSQQGRILLGDAQGGLEAYEPDGTLAWSRLVSSKPLTATPAILEVDGGIETAFVPLRDGRVIAIDVATGLPMPGFSPVAGVAFPTAAALDPRGGLLVAASSDGSLAVADLATGRIRSALPPAPGGRHEPTSMSMAGDMGVFGGTDGTALLIDDFGRSALTSVNAVLDVSGGMADADANAAAFFAGSVWLAGLAGPFVVPDLLGGAAAVGPVSPRTGPLEVGPVVDGDGDVFAAGSRGLAQLKPGGRAGYFVALAAPPAGAPTLGADGELYLQTTDGFLRAVLPSGAVGWAAQVGSGAGFASAPMLDPCSATLYLAESDGTSGTGGRLHAIVIDAPGLDTRPAAWPHFRHDYQGSGNAQTVSPARCGR
jgi:hypothetical protein